MGYGKETAANSFKRTAGTLLLVSVSLALGMTTFIVKNGCSSNNSQYHCLLRTSTIPIYIKVPTARYVGTSNVAANCSYSSYNFSRFKINNQITSRDWTRYPIILMKSGVTCSCLCTRT